jgi:hypothetical protein
VADEHHTFLAHRIDQPDDVAGQMEQAVHLDGFGLLTAGVATLVRGDDPVPRCSELGDLVPP